jgi:hypothetical protein
MRHLMCLLLFGLPLASPAFAQPAPDPSLPQATTEESVTVAVFKEALELSTDPLVIEFSSFQTIAADQLFKQDEGFQPPPAPASPPPDPAAPAQPAPVTTGPGTYRRPPSAVTVAVSPALSAQAAIGQYSVIGSTVAARPALPDTIRAETVLIRPHYSLRRVVRRVGTVPPDYAQRLANWYVPQIPTALAPGTAGAPTSFRILYLSECWANDFPASLDDQMGFSAPEAGDRPAIDRARIEAALAREDISLTPLDPFSLRTSAASREGPDPDIRSYNAELLRLYRDKLLKQPTLVLEKYCGPKAQYAYAMSLIIGQKYKVTLPPGLSDAYVSPFLFAEICNRRTGSRYYDVSCPKWRSFPDDGLLTGLGVYRLVGRKGNAVASYRFDVKPNGDQEPDVTAPPRSISLSREP